jgi:hypothetical protein
MKQTTQVDLGRQEIRYTPLQSAIVGADAPNCPTRGQFSGDTHCVPIVPWQLKPWKPQKRGLKGPNYASQSVILSSVIQRLIGEI